MAELLAEVLTPVQMTREQQSTTKVNHWSTLIRPAKKRGYLIVQTLSLLVCVYVKKKNLLVGWPTNHQKHQYRNDVTQLLPNLQWETWWLADGATQNKNNLKKAADRWARIAKIAYIRSYIRFTFLFYTWIARSSPSHTKRSKKFKRLFFCSIWRLEYFRPSTRYMLLIWLLYSRGWCYIQSLHTMSLSYSLFFFFVVEFNSDLNTEGR